MQRYVELFPTTKGDMVSAIKIHAQRVAAAWRETASSSYIKLRGLPFDVEEVRKRALFVVSLFRICYCSMTAGQLAPTLSRLAFSAGFQSLLRDTHCYCRLMVDFEAIRHSSLIARQVRHCQACLVDGVGRSAM